MKGMPLYEYRLEVSKPQEGQPASTLRFFSIVSVVQYISSHKNLHKIHKLTGGITTNGFTGQFKELEQIDINNIVIGAVYHVDFKELTYKRAA